MAHKLACCKAEVLETTEVKQGNCWLAVTSSTYLVYPVENHWLCKFIGCFGESLYSACQPICKVGFFPMFANQQGVGDVLASLVLSAIPPGWPPFYSL